MLLYIQVLTRHSKILFFRIYLVGYSIIFTCIHIESLVCTYICTYQSRVDWMTKQPHLPTYWTNTTKLGSAFWSRFIKFCTDVNPESTTFPSLGPPLKPSKNQVLSTTPCCYASVIWLMKHHTYNFSTGIAIEFYDHLFLFYFTLFKINSNPLVTQHSFKHSVV